MRAMRLFFAALVAMLAACTTAPFKTSFDYDDQATFGNYRTWAWISEHPMIIAGGNDATAPGNPLWETRIMRDIEEAMERKGYRQVDDPEAADMTIAFTLGARDKIRVNSYPATYHATYSRWGYGWGASYGYPARDVDVRQYTEGQLAIDIFDVGERRPVFHGYATGNVRRDRSQAEREAVVEDAVNAILANFPPA